MYTALLCTLNRTIKADGPELCTMVSLQSPLLLARFPHVFLSEWSHPRESSHTAPCIGFSCSARDLDVSEIRYTLPF